MSQYTYGWNYEAQLFAANGYLVVTTNPRGSSGYGKAFQMGIWQSWGVKDTQDVIAGVDHAIKLGWADADRLGVGGWSYGGILTNYVITQTQRFKAAIRRCLRSTLDQQLRARPLPALVPTRVRKPLGARAREIYEKLSSYNDVDKITTPTMWVGGKEDWNRPHHSRRDDVSGSQEHGPRGAARRLPEHAPRHQPAVLPQGPAPTVTWPGTNKHLKPEMTTAGE